MSKRLYKSNAGDLIIEQSQQIPSPYDTAYINGNLAPTGKYEVGEEKFILISNGKVYATRGQVEPGLEVELSESVLHSSEENPYVSSGLISIIRNSKKSSFIVFVLITLTVFFATRRFNPALEEKNHTQNLPETTKKRMRDSIDLLATKTLPSRDPRTQIPFAKAKYEIDTLNLRYLLEYTDILSISGQAKDAYSLLNQTLSWSDKKAKVYHGKGNVWQSIATIQQQRGLESGSSMDSSIFYYELACKTDSTDVDLFITLFNVNEYLKKYNEAIKIIEKVMKIQPANRTHYLFRGVAKFNLNDYKGAYEDLTPITDIRRLESSWYYYRGLTAAELGKYELSVRDLDTCEMLRYKTADLYYYRGKIKTHIKEMKYDGYLEVKKAMQMGYPVPQEEQDIVNKKLSERTL